MTAIEHLQAFSRPLGVKLLLENLTNEVTEAPNLVEILRIGHFKDVGICLDTGHAHIGGGVAAAIAELKPLIRTTHIHDNHGQKDEHLWPGDGTIAWAETMQELRTAPQLAAAVLEINYLPEDSPEHVATRLRKPSRCSSFSNSAFPEIEMAEEPRDERLPVAAPLATIATLNQHEGQAVTLRGWLYNLRASGKLLFPIFRDGTGTVQGIVPKAAVPPEVFERVRTLTHESSVIVTGRVRADARHPAVMSWMWTTWKCCSG